MGHSIPIHLSWKRIYCIMHIGWEKLKYHKSEKAMEKNCFILSIVSCIWYGRRCRILRGIPPFLCSDKSILTPGPFSLFLNYKENRNSTLLFQRFLLAIIPYISKILETSLFSALSVKNSGIFRYSFLSPPVHFARWAHMHCFPSVRHVTKSH